MNKVKIVLNHIKDGDFKYIFNSITKRLNHTEKSFELKRDINIPFTNPEAKVDFTIRLFEDKDFEAFKMTHTEDGLVLLNVPNCYVAVNKDDVALYRQWLVGYKHNDKLQSYYGDMLPNLKEDEALLEGAFTPPANRGQRLMPAAMARIAEKAKDIGARYIITFVVINNVPSLKGCKRSGFYPYMLRTEKWSYFKRKVTYTDIPVSLMEQYLKNVAN